MGDTSGDRPPSDPFAFLVAQRQYEEERRRTALFARFGAGGWPSAYESLQRPIPFTGVASAQILHSSPPQDPPNSDGPSLLQSIDDTTPLQLSPRTQSSQSGPRPVGPSVNGDRLITTAGGPALAAPLLIGSVLAGEAVTGIGLAAIPLTLALLLALRQASQQPGSPRLGGPTTNGSTPGGPSLPILPPPSGFPGMPLPAPVPPTTLPQPVDKPVFENIPPEIDLDTPPFPAIDDDLVNIQIKAGSKTPWADAYPEVRDWVSGIIMQHSKGTGNTPKEVDAITKEYIDVAKKWQIPFERTHGGSRTEKYLPHPITGKTGSRRPDGSFVVGPDRQIWDFNHADTRKDGITLTPRETGAGNDIPLLQEAERQALAQKEGFLRPPSQFDTFPKSRHFRGDWGRYIKERIFEIMKQRFGPPPE